MVNANDKSKPERNSLSPERTAYHSVGFQPYEKITNNNK